MTTEKMRRELREASESEITVGQSTWMCCWRKPQRSGGRARVAANRLASAVLGRALDELPPQTRRLQPQLEAWVGQRATEEVSPRAEVRFTRRDLRSTYLF